MVMEESANNIIKLAEKVYEGLSEEDVEEIERIALDRSNFFGERKYNLEELLDGITEENIHEETDFGKPVGKEIF